MDEKPGNQRHVVVTGGGTAGHVHPGLALARELAARGWTVSWIGRSGSLEQRLVAAVGLDFDEVAARPFVGRTVFGRVRAVTTLFAAVPAARNRLRKRHPAVVVGTGGYVSVPAVLAARIGRLPILLFEPNAIMGSANRLLSRLASTVAWGNRDHAGEGDRVTGVPVDPQFAPTPLRPPADGEALRILVLGGSQGSEQINHLLPAALTRLGLEAHRSLQIVHQSGPEHEHSTRRRYQQVEADAVVSVVGFIDDIARQMNESHVVISRAGAQTLAELAAIGRPAILVPLGEARSHQEHNAARPVKRGAAWLLDEPGDETLARLLASICADPETLADAAAAMAALATPDAASRLADAVEQLAEAA